MSSVPFAKPAEHSGSLAKLWTGGDMQTPSWALNIPQHASGTNPALNMPPTSVWNGSDTRNNNVAIASKIIQLAFDGTDFFTNEILPFANLPPDASGITWSKTIFGPDLARSLPEQGVPAMVRSNRFTGVEKVTRAGIGLMIESSALGTPEGAEIYRRSIDAMAVACRDTVTLSIIYAILSADLSPANLQNARMFNNWGSEAAPIESIIEKRRLMWDIIKRDQNGLLLLETKMKEAVRIYNNSYMAFDSWLLPRIIMGFVVDQSDQTNYEQQGELGVAKRNQGPDSIKTIRGANIYPVDTYNPNGDESKTGRQVMYLPTQIGEVHITEPDIYNYTTESGCLEVYDEDADNWTKLTMDQLLIGCCRFDAETGQPLDINGPQVNRFPLSPEIPASFADADFAHFRQKPGGPLLPSRFIGLVDLGTRYLDDFVKTALPKLSSFSGKHHKSIEARFEEGFRAFTDLTSLPLDEDANKFIAELVAANPKIGNTSARLGMESSVELAEMSIDATGFKFPQNPAVNGWNLSAPPGFGSWIGLKSIASAFKKGKKYVKSLGFDFSVFETLTDFYELLSSLIPIFSAYFKGSPLLNPRYASSWWPTSDVGNVLVENLLTPHGHPLFVRTKETISIGASFWEDHENGLKAFYGDVARMLRSKFARFSQWNTIIAAKAGDEFADKLASELGLLDEVCGGDLDNLDGADAKNPEQVINILKERFVPLVFASYAVIVSGDDAASLENVKQLKTTIQNGLNSSPNAFSTALTLISSKIMGKRHALESSIQAVLRELKKLAKRDVSQFKPLLDPDGGQSTESVLEFLRVAGTYNPTTGKLDSFVRSPLVFTLKQVESFGNYVGTGATPTDIAMVPSSFQNPDTVMLPDEYVTIIATAKGEANESLPASASITASIAGLYTEPKSLAVVTNVHRMQNSDILAQQIEQIATSSRSDRRGASQSIGSLGFEDVERVRRNARAGFGDGNVSSNEILRRMRATGSIGGTDYDMPESVALRNYYGQGSSYVDPTEAERSSWPQVGRYQQSTRFGPSYGGNYSTSPLGQKFEDIDPDLAMLFNAPRFVHQFASAGSAEGPALSRILKQLCLCTPFSLDNMLIFSKFDLLLPMKFIVARPHAEYTSAAIVYMIRGSQTGNTFLGGTTFMLGDDVPTQTHSGTLSFRHAPVVTSPENILRVDEAFICGYRGGMGTKFYMPNSEETPYDPSAGQYGNKSPNDTRASVFVFAVPYYEKLPSGPFSITGQLVADGGPSIRDIASLHYSSALYYSRLHGFRSPSRVQINGGRRTWDDIITSTFANTICHPGATRYFNPKENGYTRYRSSSANWGDDETYPGCHAARIGDARYRKHAGLAKYISV